MNDTRKIRFSDSDGFWNFVRYCVQHPRQVVATCSPRHLEVTIHSVH